MLRETNRANVKWDLSDQGEVLLLSLRLAASMKVRLSVRSRTRLATGE